MPDAKKRLVKNPETFRQKALKADLPKEKSTTSGKILTYPFKQMGKFFKFIKTKYDQLAKIKSLSWLFKALSILGKVIWPVYFRNSLKELKGVTWPTGKMSIKLTYAVIAFAVVFGVAIALADLGLGKIFKNILLK